jgi:hypothetical protein
MKRGEKGREERKNRCATCSVCSNIILDDSTSDKGEDEGGDGGEE